jgi:predicted DNA-binding protein (UPF0251 family)/predicted Fe-Mo cluster-binding NifX family protein
VTKKGRPKCLRRVELEPEVTYFKPRDAMGSNPEITIITSVELEAMRLIDLIGLHQEEAAQRMGISRRAFWNELKSGRRKVIKSLVEGRAIKIKKGKYAVIKRRFRCCNCRNEWEELHKAGRHVQCPNCKSLNVFGQQNKRNTETNKKETLTGGDIVKIAIPTDAGGLEDFVYEHFGRAPTFTVYDTETGEVNVLMNRGEHMGGAGKPPEFLANNGINVLLCTNLGPKAIMMFRQFGIKVYRYPGTIKVRDIIEKWKENNLSEADVDSACREHRH